jgi:hypothetical protein
MMLCIRSEAVLLKLPRAVVGYGEPSSVGDGGAGGCLIGVAGVATIIGGAWNPSELDLKRISSSWVSLVGVTGS